MKITEIEAHYGSQNRRNLLRIQPTEGGLRRLVDSLRQEPRLLASRITSQTLSTLLHSNMAIAYGTSPDNIYAFGSLWLSKDPNIHELGGIWISEKYRHRGIAPLLFQACDDLSPNTGLFLVTAEPAIVAIAIKRGWRLEGNDWGKSLDFDWNEIVGPSWERYPDSPLKEPGLLLYRKPRTGKVVCSEWGVKPA